MSRLHSREELPGCTRLSADEPCSIQLLHDRGNVPSRRKCRTHPAGRGTGGWRPQTCLHALSRLHFFQHVSDISLCGIARVLMVGMMVSFAVLVPMALPRMTQALQSASANYSYCEHRGLTKSFAPSFLQGCQIQEYATLTIHTWHGRR